MGFAFFRRLVVVIVALYKLLGDICPVTKAALHDALDQANLLQRRPISGKKGELKIVEYVIVMIRLVLRVVRRGLAQTKAFEANYELAFPWFTLGTLSAEDLNTLADVSLAERADLRTK